MEANTITVATHVSHQHELALETRTGYSCDVCRGNDGRRYRCTKGCDYDVCGKCWDQGPLTLPPGYNSARSGIHASHPHEIKFNERLGYRCDICSSCDNRRYTCSKGCNWDCCGKCWDKGPVQGVAPPAPAVSTNTLTAGTHPAHQHELKQLDRLGYSCDICRGSDNRRFHCSVNCNWDCCGKCWDNGPITPPVQQQQPPQPARNPLSSGIHGSHQHELKQMDRLGYSCDVCRSSDDRRFHCASNCNYDVCGKCWDKGPVTPPPQPVQPPSYPTNTLTAGIHSSHAHELKAQELGGYSYSCDVCRGKDERRFRCSTGCNYDVCGKCWDKGPVTPPPQPVQPPSYPTNTLTSGIHSAHAHVLKANTPVGYSCDVCRGKDERRFRCSTGCNWDCCGKCWDKGPVTPPPEPVQPPSYPTNTLSSGIHSAHAHVLKAHTPGGYSCDVCRGKDERRFHCSNGCNWDCCGKCWDKGPVTPVVSAAPAPSASSSNHATSGIHGSHAHPLKAQPAHGYSCDVCRSKDDRRFHCTSGCDYDVCGRCWDNGPVTPIPEPTPMAYSPPLASSVTPSYPSSTGEKEAGGGDNSKMLNGIHGSHPHEMKFTGVGGYSCDVCKTSDSRRYQCSTGCNYDVCGKCWDKGPVTESPASVAAAKCASLPTRGRTVHHEHTCRRADRSEAFKCDVCRQNIGNGFPYHCMQRCNWDICEECWANSDVQVSTEKEPAHLDLKTAMLFLSMHMPVDEGSMELVNAQPPGWKLHPNHPLVYSSERTKWSCDGCQIDGTDLLDRYQCTDNYCNYSLCNSCYTHGENVSRSASSPVLIAPGPPEITGLPYRNEFDETQTKFWNEFRAPYAGTVVFSDIPVDRFFTPDTLKKEFNLGSEINCRAVWPRALRNHPLGHKNGDPSTPAYGPTYILADAYGHMNIYALQVFVFVKVDGVHVGRPLKWGHGKDEEVMTDALLRATEVGPKPPGSCTGMRNDNAAKEYAKNFKPETVDFWAMNQSMTFGLVREKVNQSDDWERGMSTFMKHISGLSPGDHTVEVELRFRLVGNDDTLIAWSKLLPPSEVWPDKFPTPMSHPIAKGQFVLHVGGEPVSGGVQLTPDPFPKRDTRLDPAEAARLEALIADWMRSSGEWGCRKHQTERILKVVITGDWCKLEKEHQCKTYCKDPCPKYEREPWRWNLDFACVVYRTPTDGWPKEMPCRTFNLGAFAYNTKPQSKNDLIGIGVANSFEFDVDLVPDSAYAEAGLKRCPESLRGGFI